MLDENKDFIFPKTRDMLSANFAEPVDTFRVEVPIDPRNPESATDEIVVSIVQLPELGTGLSLELGISATNEGIYVLRNQREIASAQTLGIFARAPALTTFRAELHVPATLDKRVGINWTKQRVEPDEQLQADLKNGSGLTWPASGATARTRSLSSFTCCRFA